MKLPIGLWILPMSQFALPFLVSLTVLIAGQPVKFPLSETGTAFQIFPKLVSEHEVLTEVFSLETANNFVLSYSNAFFLGVFLLLGGLFITVIRRLLGYDCDKISPLEVSDAASYPNVVAPPGVGALIKMALLYIALLFFTFYFPIAFVPAPGSSETRLINSIYSSFIFAFPLLFLFTYLFLLAGINFLFRRITSVRKH